MNRVLLFLLFWLPFEVSAQAAITEIMYDLEGSDTGREWIEVLNTSESSIDFSTWRLFEANTNHKLSIFSGNATVAPQGYAIIADNPEKFLIDWPSFNGTLFDSSFSLSNTGEILVLRSDVLEDKDTVTYLSEWGAAGDGKSLQKVNGAWVSALPTPGASHGETVSAAVPQEGGNNQNENVPSGSVSIEPKRTILVDAGDPKRIALAGAPIAFTATGYGFEGELLKNIHFVWSFGDGSIKEGASIAYTYFYPGEYTVFLEGSAGSESATDRVFVTVIPADVVIEAIGAPEDFFVSLKNKTSHEVNIEGFVLQSGTNRFMIPKNTMLPAGKSIRFAPSVTKLLYNETVDLLYPSGSVASAYKKEIDMLVKSEEKNIALVPIQKTDLLLENPSIAPDTVISQKEASFIPEENVPAAAGAVSRSSHIQWIFALAALIGVSLAGFFFVLKQEPVAEEVLVAEDFEIIEEKQK